MAIRNITKKVAAVAAVLALTGFLACVPSHTALHASAYVPSARTAPAPAPHGAHHGAAHHGAAHHGAAHH
ncbi:hypothetical protein [Dictyobacter arantiisoli]|uniref:hypothetical protein n=1 Tax=Dictyobacter arantiisoli TaxID=2014874 RepID=UPI0011ED89D9|nr:hypothetical protein [Dictyobacter arantiisoli]